MFSDPKTGLDHLSSLSAVKFPINSVDVIKSNKILTASTGRCCKKASLQAILMLIRPDQPETLCMHDDHDAIAELRTAVRRKLRLLSAVPRRPVPGRDSAAREAGFPGRE